ncbi:hypothetical protein I4U23_004777 [Adineta vaga]|nr:hypothetical protein I4U23_004777 [Adineta vaga]
MDFFSINPIFSTVLKDNDHIICVDTKKLTDGYYQYFENTDGWLERRQYDASNKKDRFIRIGLNNISELFVKLYGTDMLNSVYTFGIYRLMEIAREKSGKKLIGRIDNTMEYLPPVTATWFLECQWDYDTDSNTCLFIICRLKTGSSEDIWSGKLQILLDQSRLCIEKGEMIHLSGEINDSSTFTNEQCQRLKELTATIPPPKRSRPQIDTTISHNLKLTKHECEGESTILMTYGNLNKVEMDQTTSDVEGTFLQQFIITSIVFSKKPTILPELLGQKRSQQPEKSISVTHLSVFYQVHDGSWRECQNITITPESSQDKDKKWSTDLIINIEPNKLVSFGIKGEILIKGTLGRTKETRTRMHKSLPQPFKLKILLTDNYGRQCALIVEQLNKPLEIITFSTIRRWNTLAKIFLALVYADDCDSDDRIYAYMGLEHSNELLIGHFCSGFGQKFDRKKFLELEHDAKQNKMTEHRLKKLDYQEDSDEIKTTILFDAITFIAYAVRFEISTKTSKTEEIVPIPMDKIK